MFIRYILFKILILYRYLGSDQGIRNSWYYLKAIASKSLNNKNISHVFKRENA